MTKTPRKHRPADTPPGEDAARRRSPVNQSDQAYARIEELLVCCALKPGQFLAMHEIQSLVGLGRTPVHQAVQRLAADTLIAISPRHGLQIQPVDLSRVRVLLDLRRDMERFVIRLATDRSGASHRNQMAHLKRQLVEHRTTMSIDQFNVMDRHIDKLLLTAAGEPFVESTLRPLHTIFRRLGWIFHMRTEHGAALHETVDHHIAVIDAVAEGSVGEAIRASDALMDFVEGTFPVLEREVPPALLDCGHEALDDSFFARPADTTAMSSPGRSVPQWPAQK